MLNYTHTGLPLIAHKQKRKQKALTKRKSLCENEKREEKAKRGNEKSKNKKVIVRKTFHSFCFA